MKMADEIAAPPHFHVICCPHLIDALASFIVRYLFPHSMRLRLFVNDISALRDSLGPIAYLREPDLMGYTMQADILHKYYRI